MPDVMREGASDAPVRILLAHGAGAGMDHAFLAELSRYRPGHLRATPAVAGLRISGVFQLTDIDGVLDNLATTLPVRVNRFTRYWAQLEAR